MELKIKYTQRELELNCRNHKVIVPKGTKCHNDSAMGISNTYFVKDLSFIPKEEHLLIHDATYYGIQVPEIELIDRFVVQVSETGNIITSFETEIQAHLEVIKYEAIDKAEGNYKPNFYEVYDFKTKEVLTNGN